MNVESHSQRMDTHDVDVLVISSAAPEAERKLIEQVLGEHRASFKPVSSYKQAIEELAKRKYPIVILYCFKDREDFEATEAVRIMKGIVPGLLIIAISQETPLETERELRKSGLFFHLTTPIDRAEFEEVLSGAIKTEKTRRK